MIVFAQARFGEDSARRMGYIFPPGAPGSPLAERPPPCITVAVSRWVIAVTLPVMSRPLVLALQLRYLTSFLVARDYVGRGEQAGRCGGTSGPMAWWRRRAGADQRSAERETGGG